jgi:hypothetical protein
MTDLLAVLMVIAKHVRRQFGEKSLNELIAQGIAVYLEIVEALPKARALKQPTADPEVVAGVIDELATLEA